MNIDAVNCCWQVSIPTGRVVDIQTAPARLESDSDTETYEQQGVVDSAKVNRAPDKRTDWLMQVMTTDSVDVRLLFFSICFYSPLLLQVRCAPRPNQFRFLTAVVIFYCQKKICDKIKTSKYDRRHVLTYLFEQIRQT